MSQYFGLIPAAGLGIRMRSSIPKQFLEIKGKPLIEWTIRALAKHEIISGLLIGLANSEKDSDWLNSVHPKISGVFKGGESRSETVLNGCNHLMKHGCSKDDWVLVHDANRPLLTADEITRLIETVGEDQNGGILCLPVYDTLKCGSDGKIAKTLDRENCYRALTPQMFKLGLLHDALSQCVNENVMVTDEAQAMERLGFRPWLVPGSATNIKITTPSDLKFAEVMIDADLSE